MDSLSKEVNLIITSCIFLTIVAAGIIMLVMAYQRKQLQFLREKEQFKVILDKEILKTQLEIQEQTLKKISEEIHDNIGQTLSLAKLNLNTLDLQKQTRAEEKISVSKELVSKAIRDLRSLSKTLNTDTILSSGLLRAIEFELQLLDKAGEFKTEFKIIGNPVKIDAQKELILFRIVQEALNNIIKHAQANVVTIEITFKDHILNLSIGDNGRGFKIESDHNDIDGGSGLNNMRNRADIIGGNFYIESSSVHGSKIHLTVPIKEI